MSEWKVICRVDDIPVLGSRRVAREQGLDVAVFRNDQTRSLPCWTAARTRAARCRRASCLAPAWPARCTTGPFGLAAAGEGARRRLHTRFAVKVEDGQVSLNAAELARHATDLTRPVAGPAKTSVLRDRLTHVAHP
jgi:nitrite reductase (NADH) small subunit